MKMTREFNVENVTRICEKISKYYADGENGIKEIEGLINESINPKS